MAQPHGDSQCRAGASQLRIHLEFANQSGSGGDHLRPAQRATAGPERSRHGVEQPGPVLVGVPQSVGLATLFERDPEALPTLLQIFSTSQHLSDLLIRDPESFDLLRLTEGQPVAREVLVDEICAETAAAVDERDVMALLRRHKRRETLRIAYGDIVRAPAR